MHDDMTSSSTHARLFGCCSHPVAHEAPRSRLGVSSSGQRCQSSASSSHFAQICRTRHASYSRHLSNAPGYHDAMRWYDTWYHLARDFACLSSMYISPGGRPSMIHIIILTTELNRAQYAAADPHAVAVFEMDSCGHPGNLPFATSFGGRPACWPQHSTHLRVRSYSARHPCATFTRGAHAVINEA